MNESKIESLSKKLFDDLHEAAPDLEPQEVWLAVIVAMKMLYLDVVGDLEDFESHLKHLPELSKAVGVEAVPEGKDLN